MDRRVLDACHPSIGCHLGERGVSANNATLTLAEFQMFTTDCGLVGKPLRNSAVVQVGVAKAGNGMLD